MFDLLFGIWGDSTRLLRSSEGKVATLAISTLLFWDTVAMESLTSPSTHWAVDQLRSQAHYCAWNDGNCCGHSSLEISLVLPVVSFFLIHVFKFSSIYWIKLFCIFPKIPTSKLLTGLFCCLLFLLILIPEILFSFCFVIFYFIFLTL